MVASSSVRSRRTRIVCAQAAELAPMTAAWSSPVQVRPWAAANAIRASSHQISESTRTPSRSKMTASLRMTVPSGPRAAGRPDAVERHRTVRAGPPSGRPWWRPWPPPCRTPVPARAGSAARTTIDGRERIEDERGHLVGGLVGPAQDHAFERDAQDPVAALHLDRQVAELHPVPADELAAGARALARDVDPDVDLGQARVGRREDRVAHRRVVAPGHPALRVRVRARASPASAR